MSKSVRRNKQSGFTIVELMIATLIFSLVLIAAMAALVQIGRLYYRGVTQARTQEVARSITEEITQAIQFSSANIDPGTKITAYKIDPTAPESAYISHFCIGEKRYTYAIDRQVAGVEVLADKKIPHGLWVDIPGEGCAQILDETGSIAAADLRNPNLASVSDGREILDRNMRLSRVHIEKIDETENGEIWQVSVSVVYGDTDLLRDNISGDNYECETAAAGVEFCAISTISTTVTRRVL